MTNLLHSVRTASVGACLLLAAPVALSGVQVIPPEPAISEVTAATDVVVAADENISFRVENADTRCFISLPLTVILAWPLREDADAGPQRMITCGDSEATFSMARTSEASGTQELVINFCVTEGTSEAQLGKGTTIYLEADGTTCGTVAYLLAPQ